MDFGLDSLAAELESENTGGSVQLDISNISRDVDQPRTTFDDDKLQRLADSINAQGVIQPIIVRVDDNAEDSYIIIAGERRWRAAKLAGLETIPAIVKSADSTEIVASQIIENIDREGFTLLDEVRAVAKMCKICGNATKAGDALGKPKSWISKRVKIAKGGEILEAFIHDGGTVDVQGTYQLARLIEKFPEEGEYFIRNWIDHPDSRGNLRKKVATLMTHLENPPPPVTSSSNESENTVNATDSEQVNTQANDVSNDVSATDSAQENSQADDASNVVNATDSVKSDSQSSVSGNNKPTINRSVTRTTSSTSEEIEEVRSYKIEDGNIILITNGHRFAVDEALIRLIHDEL